MAVEGFCKLDRETEGEPPCAMFAPTCRGAQCAPVTIRDAHSLRRNTWPVQGFFYKRKALF